MKNNPDSQTLIATINEHEKSIAQLKSLVSKLLADQQKLFRQISITKDENRQLRMDLQQLQQSIRRF